MKLTIVPAVCLVALALAGCSDDSGSSASSSTTAPTTSMTSHEGMSHSSTTAPSSPAPSSAEAATLAPGQSRVIIDGNEVDGGAVTCISDSGVTTVTVGEGTTGASFVVAADGALQSLGIGDLGGVSLGYIEGAGEAPPTVTQEGGVYRVVGSGNGTDTDDPSELADISYDISAVCP